jgi:iron complex transport system substrate-binding protein
VIVTQDHCAVCAVSLKDVERAVCDWLEGQPRIVSLHPNALADLWTGIRQVADALEAPHRGQQLIARLEHRLREVSGQALEQPERPTVACIEWIDPLMSAGNWMPELVELAGGVNLFGQAGQHSPHMTWADLVVRDPDVIAVMPCGWDIPKSREELAVLMAKPEWSGLKAVRRRRVFLTDGNQYFNRPGPRLVESLEILAELLHPALRFGHEGKGWQRLG